MIFIFGGKYQGKTAYAINEYDGEHKICDLAKEGLSYMYEADIIKNVQDGVRQLLSEDIEPIAYFVQNMKSLEQKILVGTEIGCGIVPIDDQERIWRDETGRVYQLLAGKAQKVVRLWAGIPMTIKDNCDIKIEV